MPSEPFDMRPFTDSPVTYMPSGPIVWCLAYSFIGGDLLALGFMDTPIRTPASHTVFYHKEVFIQSALASGLPCLSQEEHAQLYHRLHMENEILERSYRVVVRFRGRLPVNRRARMKALTPGYAP